MIVPSRQQRGRRRVHKSPRYEILTLGVEKLNLERKVLCQVSPRQVQREDAVWIKYRDGRLAEGNTIGYRVELIFPLRALDDHNPIADKARRPSLVGPLDVRISRYADAMPRRQEIASRCWEVPSLREDSNGIALYVKQNTFYGQIGQRVKVPLSKWIRSPRSILGVRCCYRCGTK